MNKRLLALTTILLIATSTIVLASTQWQSSNQNNSNYMQSQTNQSSTGEPTVTDGSDDSPRVRISVYENSFPINETSPLTPIRTFETGNDVQRSYVIESSGILYPYNTTNSLNKRLLEDKDNATIIERINWGDVPSLPPHGGAQLTSNTRTITIVNNGNEAVTISIPTISLNFAEYTVSAYNYTLVVDPSQTLQPGQKTVIAVFLYVSAPDNSNPEPLPFSLDINIVATKASE